MVRIAPYGMGIRFTVLDTRFNRFTSILLVFPPSIFDYLVIEAVNLLPSSRSPAAGHLQVTEICMYKEIFSRWAILCINNPGHVNVTSNKNSPNTIAKFLKFTSVTNATYLLLHTARRNKLPWIKRHHRIRLRHRKNLLWEMKRRRPGIR